MSKDWPLLPLSDLARVDRGASWRAKDERTDGTGVPVIRIANTQPQGLDLTDVRSVADMGPNEMARATIKAETLLMVGSNGNPDRVGNVYPAESSIVGSVLASFLIGIHPREGIDSLWLLLCLQSADTQRAITESTAGSTGLKNLSLAWLRSLKVPLPPLPVQRRIVDLMEHLDDQVSHLDTEALSLMNVYEAALRGLLPPVGDVPLSGVLSKVRAGGTPSRKRPEFYGGSIPWLKSGEVNDDHIATTEEHITEDGLNGSSAWLVPEGAVVLAMYGATAGQAGCLDTALATNQAVLALVPDPQKCDGRFLLHWTRSHADRLRAAASGAAQPNLSKEVVLRVVEFPALTVPEQRQKASVLDAARDTWHNVKRESDRVRLLRSQVLASLLTGHQDIPASYDEFLGVAS